MAQDFPTNILKLYDAGVNAEWRQEAKDAVTLCPACTSKLILHETDPWHHCFGPFRCPVNRMPFADMMSKLTTKSKGKA